MKRLLSFVLILLMLLSMAACSADEVSQTNETADEVVNLQTKEPVKERKLNGVSLTYQSTDSTDPANPVDLYADVNRGEYKYCRCGRLLQYRSEIIYGVTLNRPDNPISSDQAIEIATPFLKECYGEMVDRMSVDLREIAYSVYPAQHQLSYVQYVGEDGLFLVNSVIIYVGLNGTVMGLDFYYHSHELEAFDYEKLNVVKKADVDSYIDEIIANDPEHYQDRTKADVDRWQQLVFKNGEIAVEIHIQGEKLGQKVYDYELPDIE